MLNLLRKLNSINKKSIADMKMKLTFLGVFIFVLAFFMEVCDIKNGKMDDPIIVKAEGEAPEQILPDLMTGNDLEDDDIYEMEEEADDYYKYDEGIDEDVDLESFGMDLREDY